MVHHLLREAGGGGGGGGRLNGDGARLTISNSSRGGFRGVVIREGGGRVSRAFTTLGQSRGLSPMAYDFISFASMMCSLAFNSCP